MRALFLLALAACASGAVRPRAARRAPRAQPVLSAAGSAPPLQLGSFPFPLSECLMPGESKQLHLYEARFACLLEHALKRSGGLATQMAFAESGSALAVCSLVSIEKVVPRDVGTNVVLRCVGRVRITEIVAGEPFILGRFAEHVDAPHTSAAQRAYLSNQLAELCALHAECAAIGRSMVEKCAAAGIRPPFAATDDPAALAEEGADEEGVYGGPVTWGHELTRPDSGFNRPLEAQLAEALAAVAAARARAAAEAPLLALLGADGEEGSDAAQDARFSLASLLACACFPTQSRLEAICELDSAQRMDTALALLKERRAMLAAKLALVGALVGSGGAAGGGGPPSGRAPAAEPTDVDDDPPEGGGSRRDE